jgi:hypothetical protein
MYPSAAAPPALSHALTARHVQFIATVAVLVAINQDTRLAYYTAGT